jgi:hypothetical protein
LLFLACSRKETKCFVSLLVLFFKLHCINIKNVWAFIFLNYSKWQLILKLDHSTAVYICMYIKDLSLTPWRWFEPGISSRGGRDGHAARTQWIDITIISHFEVLISIAWLSY